MTTPSFKRDIINIAKIAILGVVLTAGVDYIFAAWSAPTATAPSGNVAAPINTSSTAQSKAGAFAVGTTNAPQTGMALDVEGPAYVNGTIFGNALKISGGNPVTGDVLAASDGTGNTSWQTPGSGMALFSDDQIVANLSSSAESAGWQTISLGSNGLNLVPANATAVFLKAWATCTGSAGCSYTLYGGANSSSDEKIMETGSYSSPFYGGGSNGVSAGFAIIPLSSTQTFSYNLQGSGVLGARIYLTGYMTGSTEVATTNSLVCTQNGNTTGTRTAGRPGYTTSGTIRNFSFYGGLLPVGGHYYNYKLEYDHEGFSGQTTAVVTSPGTWNDSADSLGGVPNNGGSNPTDWATWPDGSTTPGAEVIATSSGLPTLTIPCSTINYDN